MGFRFLFRENEKHPGRVPGSLGGKVYVVYRDAASAGGKITLSMTWMTPLEA
jgi:hypothetical protein